MVFLLWGLIGCYTTIHSLSWKQFEYATLYSCINQSNLTVTGLYLVSLLFAPSNPDIQITFFLDIGSNSFIIFLFMQMNYCGFFYWQLHNWACCTRSWQLQINTCFTKTCSRFLFISDHHFSFSFNNLCISILYWNMSISAFIILTQCS